MQSNIIKDITDYIDFLRVQGFSVTLSCFDNVLGQYLPVLLKYEVHLSAVCSYLKSNSETCGYCPQNKRNLEKKVKSEPYYSCCYAGVEEFVVPIIFDDTLICCANVSGYRGKMPVSARIAKRFEKRLGEHFSYLYGQLNESVPELETVVSAVKPLYYMFSELRRECMRSVDSGDSASQIYRKALRYIYDNYMNDFTLNDMAKTLNYSPSYLRHTFTKQSGKTILQTVNSVRLSQAAVLLRTTKLSVTHIALECGFCDGNYFSTVFKKKYGITPKNYRNNG